MESALLGNTSSLNLVILGMQYGELLPLLFYFELHFLLFLVTSETLFYILNLPIFDISFVDEVFIYSLHIYSCYLVYYSCFLMVNRVKLFYYNVTDHTIMETLLL